MKLINSKIYFPILFLIFTFAINQSAFSCWKDEEEQLSIKGVIVDESGKPIPGVTIQIQDTYQGTVSDIDGGFEIKGLPTRQSVVVISYLGYETQVKNIDDFLNGTLLKINLQPAMHSIEGIQVVGNNGRSIRKIESIPVERISRDYLEQNRSGSLMQTLSRIPGVHSMDIGSGLSKPMIRGLGYYRVVFAQHGIKQAGQHWNSHTGLSVDQQNIQRVEIIKGPASLRYGSDAIGGVINTLPADIPENGIIKGELSLTGKSNTGWIGGSLNLSARRGSFYLHANATHNNFGDFRVPNTDVFYLPAPVSAVEATHKVELGGNRVPNTAGRENATTLTTGIIRKNIHSYLDFQYHSAKTGFFDWVGLQHENTRNDHQASARDIRLPYQKVDNWLLSHFTNIFFDENKLELALAYQHNISAEHNLLSDRTGNRMADLIYFRNRDNLELLLKMQTVTANASYTLSQVENHDFEFVVNSNMEKNTTDGYSHILPEYRRFSTGTGIIHRYYVSSRVTLNSGVRFDLHHFEMDESLNPDPAFGDSIFNPCFSKNYQGTALALGLNYILNESTTLKFNIGKSYRAPSAYEIGAYGLHRHEGRFEKGDLDINPEQAWQLDAGMERKFGEVNLQVTPFVNYFTNYLFLNPTPDLRPEGQVYEYRQSAALLYGGELTIDYIYRNKISFLAGAEYVYALNLDAMMPLPFTPPGSLLTSIRYLASDRGIFNAGSIGIEGLLVAAQRFTVPNELNTPEYFSLNVNAQTQINALGRPVQLRLELKNLLDARYYNHVSFYRRMRIPEQGRDVQLYINIPF